MGQASKLKAAKKDSTNKHESKMGIEVMGMELVIH